MNIFAIGVGGAGNKAIIRAIQSGIIHKEDSLLLNTTLADIDSDFHDISMTFGSSMGGCGKERNKSKSYIVEGLQDELKHISVVKDDKYDLVLIATSTEGGTGSGSSIILAKYIHQVLGKPVQIFAFNGFEEDGRGLKNTVEFFQEIEHGISIQSTANSKFLVDTTNRQTAEAKSNEDFIRRIRVLIGRDLIKSDQNIDKTDLFKVSTQVGYTVCNRIDLPKIKNIEQYNKIIKSALDNDEAADTTKTVKRLALMFNVSEDTRDMIDFYATVFKNKFGQPFEVYTHIQYNDGPEYIDYIASGLDLPLDEIKDVYEKYKANVENVNKKHDKFFDESNKLQTMQSDDMFDLESDSYTISANSFFDNINKSSKPKKKNPVKEKVIHVELEDK